MLKHQVGTPKRDFHSKKEVCKVMGLDHSLLISDKPPAGIDCMGREVLLSDFCEKVADNDRPLLRGKLDPFSDKVLCEFGQTLNLSYRCRPDHYHYCESATSGCLQFQNVFARRLELSHSSILPDGADQRLNCYFKASQKQADNQELMSPLKEIESL